MLEPVRVLPKMFKGLKIIDECSQTKGFLFFSTIALNRKPQNQPPEFKIRKMSFFFKTVNLVKILCFALNKKTTGTDTSALEQTLLVESAGTW